MKNIGQQIKEQLIALHNEGIEILLAEVEEKTRKVKKGEKDDIQKPMPAIVRYQSWYTKALPVVRQLIPERYQEFQEQYKLEKRKEIDYATYTISDYLIGLRVTRLGEDVVDPLSAFATKFQQQIFILMQVMERLNILGIFSLRQKKLNQNLMKGCIK